MKLVFFQDLLNAATNDNFETLDELESAHYLYPVDIKKVLTNDDLRTVVCRNFWKSYMQAITNWNKEIMNSVKPSVINFLYICNDVKVAWHLRNCSAYLIFTINPIILSNSSIFQKFFRTIFLISQNRCQNFLTVTSCGTHGSRMFQRLVAITNPSRFPSLGQKSIFLSFLTTSSNWTTCQTFFS